MRFINKKMVVVVIMIGIICTIFIWQNISDKETKLESVSLNESKTLNNEMFAIMLEQSDGTYKEETTTKWPSTGYMYNSSMSGCIDINGNKIDNSLTYDKTNNIATVDTTSTSYCYLYFDIKITTETLPSVAGSDMWDSTLEEDGYRYIGTNPNNYICFGTEDKNECINNTNKYMYRIIVIFEDSRGVEHIKLIKKEALDTAYAWHSDASVDIDWDESDLYNGLNGEYFLNNSTYSYMQNPKWIDKIVEWNYTAVNTLTYADEENDLGPNYYLSQAEEVYLHEMNRSTKDAKQCTGGSGSFIVCSEGEWKTVNSKLGLMYASDYLLALGNDALNYASFINDAQLKTGWIFLRNNDSGLPSYYEWTMAWSSVFVASDVIETDVWAISRPGRLQNEYLDETYSIRPVFYLINDIEITGKGTIDNPYIIK